MAEQADEVRPSKRKSVFYTDNNELILDESDRKRVIIARRGCFRWMPVLFANDLVHGSWYYVYGSLLAAIIPIFPLVSMFQTYDPRTKFWAKPGFLPLAENVAVYVMLILVGVLYTIGSLTFVRAVEEPHLPPLFPNFRHFATDELLGMWLFTLGTFPSIPITLLYVVFNPRNGSFWMALLVCTLATIFMFVITLMCYPTGAERKPTKVLHYMICACMCKKSCYGIHFANDWLIACWAMVVGCALGAFISLVLLFDSIMIRSGLHIYEYVTGFIDTVLFLIGSMYLTAGSYEIVVENVGEGKPVKIEFAHDVSNKENETANPVGPIGIQV
eukprot:gene28221-37134_t